MGISVSFHRVAMPDLQDLLARQDEHAVVEHIVQDFAPFPYSLHHLDLGKGYGMIDTFLNPTRDRSSPLWPVFHGGFMLVTDPGVVGVPNPDTMYLGAAYYFRPPEVQRLRLAMAEIHDYTDQLERYRVVVGAPPDADLFDPTYLPPFQTVLDLFLTTFCFFHIADQAGDAVLRYYSG